MPPPRRVNRDPTEYIRDADWDAIRNDRAFASTAPQTAAPSPTTNDAESVVCETTASAEDLTRPREWSETYRRRSKRPSDIWRVL